MTCYISSCCSLEFYLLILFIFNLCIYFGFVVKSRSVRCFEFYMYLISINQCWRISSFKSKKYSSDALCKTITVIFLKFSTSDHISIFYRGRTKFLKHGPQVPSWSESCHLLFPRTYSTFQEQFPHTYSAFTYSSLWNATLPHLPPTLYPPHSSFYNQLKNCFLKKHSRHHLLPRWS